MKKFVRILAPVALALLLATCSPKTAVTSPDGRIEVQFSLDAAGLPLYEVEVDGRPFLEPSAMGLVCTDAPQMPLSQLGDAPDAHWESNPTAYEIATRSVTAEDTLTLRLAPGGGAAVSFLPE